MLQLSQVFEVVLRKRIYVAAVFCAGSSGLLTGVRRFAPGSLDEISSRTRDSKAARNDYANFRIPFMLIGSFNRWRQKLSFMVCLKHLFWNGAKEQWRWLLILSGPEHVCECASPKPQHSDEP